MVTYSHPLVTSWQPFGHPLVNLVGHPSWSAQLVISCIPWSPLGHPLVTLVGHASWLAQLVTCIGQTTWSTMLVNPVGHPLVIQVGHPLVTQVGQTSWSHQLVTFCHPLVTSWPPLGQLSWTS